MVTYGAFPAGEYASYEPHQQLVQFRLVSAQSYDLGSSTTFQQAIQQDLAKSMMDNRLWRTGENGGGGVVDFEVQRHT